jgi:hypothetical protein
MPTSIESTIQYIARRLSPSLAQVQRRRAAAAVLRPSTGGREMQGGGEGAPPQHTRLPPEGWTPESERALPVSEGSERWIADADARTCGGCRVGGCGREFSVYRRKHHCRGCGGVFCAKCSGAKHDFASQEGQTARLRVCDPCAAQPGAGLAAAAAADPAWFQVDSGGALAFRSAPTMDQKTAAVARPGELVYAAAQPPEHEGWIRTREDLWLPKQFLLPLADHGMTPQEKADAHESHRCAKAAAAAGTAPEPFQPSWFRVDDGGAVWFRESPDMEDRASVAAGAGDLLFISEHSADRPGWMKTEEGLWIHAQFLAPVPTGTPLAEAVLEEARLSHRATAEARRTVLSATHERVAAEQEEHQTLAPEQAEENALVGMEVAAAAMPTRDEMSALRLGAVKAKARALGVDEDALELADDTEDPKLTVIDLVMAAATTTVADRQQPAISEAVPPTSVAAAANAERERLAVEKACEAEQERLAAKNAECERLSAEKAEQEWLAAEKAEQERLVAETAEEERVAAEEEAVRVAKEKVESQSVPSLSPTNSAVEEEQEEATAKANQTAEEEQVATSSPGLRDELVAMKFRVLKQRALEAGVNEVLIEDALDEEDPKAAMVELVLAAAPSASAMSRRTQENAEQDREEAAREKAEQERLAREKTEQQERLLAAEEAQQEKLAAEEEAAPWVAAEEAEAETARLAAEEAEAERLAAEQAEAERLAAEEAEAEAECVATMEVEAARVAAEEAETARLAAEEAEAETARLAAEEAEAERLAAEQAEAERLAAEQAEAERLAAEEAEAARVAAEEAEAETARLAAEEVEAARLAAEQAEAERLAAEQAEAERLAAEQAEAARVAAEEAEAARLAAEEAEAETARLAAEEAEAERLAAEEAEAARVATEEAELEPEPEPAVCSRSDEIWDDDQHVLVIDAGSTMCKAGLAGSGAPRAVFPAVVGTLKSRFKGDPGSVRSPSNIVSLAFLPLLTSFFVWLVGAAHDDEPIVPSS